VNYFHNVPVILHRDFSVRFSPTVQTIVTLYNISKCNYYCSYFSCSDS